MISIKENQGSGFSEIGRFKGRFGLKDALLYHGIYDDLIFTNSGKVILGFLFHEEDFRENQDFEGFVSSFDDEVEFCFQVYLIYSRTQTSLFLFLTVPYPYGPSLSVGQNLKFALSPKAADRFFSSQYRRVLVAVESLRAKFKKYFPKSTPLTSAGLNGFLNLVLNRNLNELGDITDYIFDDFNFHFDHYTYNQESRVALKLKNFPKEKIFPDLIFHSGFDFPFILQTTVTRPTRRDSNKFFLKESDYAEKLKGIFKSAQAKEAKMGWGDDIALTQTLGNHIYHFDMTAHFFNKDTSQLAGHANLFRERFRDFGIIFTQENLNLTGVISAYFPGLASIFQDRLQIFNSDLKYLLPLKRKEYRKLESPRDIYPAFVEEAPPEPEEAIFENPAFVPVSGPKAPELPDEEDQARETGDASKRDAFSISTKKDLESEDRAGEGQPNPGDPGLNKKELSDNLNRFGL